MIGIGESHGCPVVALCTAMDRPLGRACGNALEVEEAIAALKGEGPADLVEVTLALSVEMLLLAGVERDRDAGLARLGRALASGEAAEQFRRIVERQGGDPDVLDDAAIAVGVAQGDRAREVRGTATIAGDEEESELTVDYLPAGTSVEVSIGFSAEPDGEVTVQVVGFRLP